MQKENKGGLFINVKKGDSFTVSFGPAKCVITLVQGNQAVKLNCDAPIGVYIERSNRKKGVLDKARGSS